MKNRRIILGIIATIALPYISFPLYVGLRKCDYPYANPFLRRMPTAVIEYHNVLVIFCWLFGIGYLLTAAIRLFKNQKLKTQLLEPTSSAKEILTFSFAGLFLSGLPFLQSFIWGLCEFVPFNPLGLPKSTCGLRFIDGLEWTSWILYLIVIFLPWTTKGKATFWKRVPIGCSLVIALPAFLLISSLLYALLFSLGQLICRHLIS